MRTVGLAMTVTAALAMLGFLLVPGLILSAPIEPVMGVVQKIFYFHVPCAIMLFLIMIAYMLARRYGGPGGKRLAAALALFAAVDVPLVYKSVDMWRTIH